MIPPASAVNYVPWALVGFIFQYVIRRRHFPWWTKYNYVLSAALDAGVAISAVLIFFCLQYPQNGSIGLNNIQVWWGNTGECGVVTIIVFNSNVLGTVFTKTADSKGTPMLTVADGEIFG